MSEIKAISPDEIIQNLGKIIPPAIIAAVNQLLMEKYRGTGVRITLKEIIAKAISIDETLTSTIISEKKYLDFEDLYRKSGWAVSCDTSGYNENYDAYFIFKKKKI